MRENLLRICAPSKDSDKCAVCTGHILDSQGCKFFMGTMKTMTRMNAGQKVCFLALRLV